MALVFDDDECGAGVSYVEELARELAAAGIRGRRRARIVAEFSDHLACDPAASLGPPADVARRFADELGSAQARRAGLRAFAALAAAGVLFAAAFLAMQAEGLPVSRWGYSAEPLGALGPALIALGAQVAFVSGLLALVRTVRLRGDSVLARREATLIARRAMVGLLAGLACLVGLALVGGELRQHMPPWWQPLAFGAAGLGSCFLAAAAPTVITALRTRPLQGGPAGDLGDDLGALAPAVLRRRPWLLAVIIALGVGAVIAFAGVLQDDPYDGMLRGLADACACLAGFAVLGPYLGLRRSGAQ
jgi:hypothetical protein